MESESPTTLATFGFGCFWCGEAIFQQIKGVTKVTSGYAGGKIKDPTYKDLKAGKSDQAEVIQIEFDKTIIKY